MSYSLFRRPSLESAPWRFSTEIALIIPAFALPGSDVDAKCCRNVAPLRRSPVICTKAFKYLSQTLTKGLPGFVSSGVHAYAAQNVTAADDLPPISAPLTLYDRSSLHNKGNGVTAMAEVTAKAVKKADKLRKPSKSSSESIALHLCYREIGISAVAAAARYQGSAKNAAYAPVASE